jgi:hypothetical protein
MIPQTKLNTQVTGPTDPSPLRQKDSLLATPIDSTLYRRGQNFFRCGSSVAVATLGATTKKTFLAPLSVITSQVTRD